MTSSPIVANKLTKHYGRFEALKDLDLEVAPGEVFGFLGPNGAGKSTTIRCLLGELKATSGSATVLGADPIEVAHRSRLGYVPADLSLWPGLTGRQTLALFAKLRGGVDEAYRDSLVKRLDADLEKKVGELSTGNRQKIGLITAFMHKPELLILDEPNAGLDPLVQHEFWAMMREAADEGRSVFLSSHTLSEVERVADRVGIIRKGHLIDVEEVAALRRKRMRRVELDIDGTLTAADLAGLKGVRNVAVEPGRVTLDFDGEISELLTAVTAKAHLRDLHTQEADLEDIFLAYYQETA